MALEAITSYFQHPWILLLVIPAFFLTLFFTFKEFKFIKKEEPISLIWKTMIFMSRFTILALVIVALATPKIQTEVTERGNPYVKILVDNSTSMALFDTSFVPELRRQMAEEINVETATIAYGDESALGDNIMQHLRKNTNLLLITDGNNNKGASLNDVAVIAKTLNASISAINMKEVNKDAAIEIIGPEKTIAGIENEFIITVKKAGDITDYNVKVYIDDSLILNEGPKEAYNLVQAFPDGEHKIKAVLESNDLFSNNNEFYRTIKVVPKPKLLMLSEKDSPLRTLLANLYDITLSDSLPSDGELKKYASVILNDVNAKKLERDFAAINEYVADGNGLVAVGGYNSFDKGGYKDSKIETILPVYVAQAGKDEGIINVILLIDISGSTLETVGTEQILRVSKALGLAIFKQMDFDNRIGVMAFNDKPYLVVQPDFVANAADIEHKIATLKYGGGTKIGDALYGAMQVLEPLDGSKNIILLSDGRTQQEGVSYEAAALAAKKGIKVYAVTVGDNANEATMRNYAKITNGIHFRATQYTSLELIFGDPDKTQKDLYPLVILNEDHFITSGSQVIGSIAGFNTVTPKSTAQLLMTTDTADPVLTVWQFGLGRVAAISTDDGNVWAGKLLNRQNGKFVTRIFNWAVGDPERNNDEFVDVPDGTLDNIFEITVKAPEKPRIQGLSFYEQNGLYKATFLPEGVGIGQLHGTLYGVNYKAEYANIGFNKNLNGLVETTNGRMFEKEQVREIIEYIRTRSVIVRTVEKEYRWPFLTLAIVIFLIEILLRRIREMRIRSKIYG